MTRPLAAAALPAILGLALAVTESRVDAVCSPQTMMSPLGNGVSLYPSVSGDGRYTAFASDATDLVPGDTNGVRDIFVFDRTVCTVERVSVASDGSQIFGWADPSISDDGRYVVFRSPAFNQIYVRDRQLGTIVMASAANGTQNPGNSESRGSSISGDGQFVVFYSQATNLVAGDTNGEWDVFVRDLATSATTRVSVASGGVQGTGDAVSLSPSPPAISNDGRFAVFASNKTNLVSADTNGGTDVFRHDRQTGTTIRVSLATGGGEGNGPAGAAGGWWPTVSGDGRHVAFMSSRAFVTGDDSTLGFPRVYVRDITTDLTTRVAVAGHGSPSAYSTTPTISGDGRYVAFYTTAALTPDGTQVLVRDRLTSITRGVAFGRYPSLSDDGLFVGFTSWLTTLVPGDTNGVEDVFIANWPAIVTPKPNLVQNGDFSNGFANWSAFGITVGDIVWDASSGVLQFHRKTGAAQAVVLQEANAPLPAGAPLVAQFDLGNSSNVNKRISILIHEFNFTDLHVCTFWLAPNAPMRTYTMRTHTTAVWGKPTIAFYAASADSAASYLVDNVSLVWDPDAPGIGTNCPDPTAPLPPGGPASANLLTNWDFASGLSPWGTFGSIVWQAAGGVFEFHRPPAAGPAGVVLQGTGQAMANLEIMSATFKLGNSSSVRKRVTILLHAGDFSGLSACTFWLPAGAPLASFSMRTFANKPWSNTTLSVYASTVDSLPSIRLDDVVLQRTPGVAVSGTECIEPVSPGFAGATGGQTVAPVARTPVRVLAVASGVAGFIGGGDVINDWLVSDTFAATFAEDGRSSGWMAVAAATGPHVLTAVRQIDLRTATTARLRFWSWLTSDDSTAKVEVRVDGGHWEALQSVQTSSNWALVDVDLGAYLGELIEVRFAFDGIEPMSFAAPDVWRLDDVQLEFD